MAAGGGSFRSRAASLLPHVQHSILRSLRPESNAEKPALSSQTTSGDKTKENAPLHGLEKTLTQTSSGGTRRTSGSDAIAHDKEAQRVVRTIPTWVYALDEDDEDLFATRSLTEPTLPSETHAAHHNTTPGFFGHSYPPRGRLHDHEREWTPPLPRETVQETGSRWRKFAHSSLYPRLSADLEGEVVTQEWLVENGPDYSQPWLAGADNGDPEKGNASIFRWRLKRRAWYEKLARTTLRSPLVPLVIRMVVFGFSMIALALACSIYTLANRDSDPISGSSTDRDYNSTPSTLMAIAVDAVAMVYLLGVTYDEYSGKPLGLRPPSAKMRLIFLDLFFIVFDSANLSLAFEALGGNSNCGVVCNQQRALASVLLIALLAWLMTFSISVMRVVERVHGR